MTGRSKYPILVGALALVFASTLWAQKPRKSTKGKEITVRGRLTDVHSYMTGKSETEDNVKATQDSFRAGAAAGIETEEGLVILGSGDKGPARMIVPLAQQQVEAKGKLFEKDGLRYLDLASIQAHRTKDGPKPSEEEHEVVPDDQPSEEPAPEDSEIDDDAPDEEP